MGTTPQDQTMSEKAPTEVSAQGHHSYEEEFRAIGHILVKDARKIVERWFERATEEQVHADQHQREVAMNELFEMLQSLGQQLHKQSSDALQVASQLARDHGEQRFDIKWNIVDLVRDYEILHGVALEHLGQVLNERLTYRQAMILATVMNGAIGHAVHAYTALTQGRLEKQVQGQQAELRQLTLHLTETEHRERQRLAAMLHDDLQQILVATRMKLHLALRGATSDPEMIEEVKSLFDEAVEISRNVARDLHPMILEHRGLPEALEWLGEMTEQRYALAVTVDLQIAPGCNPGSMALRRLVYDAVRELLFNVVKHAKTEHARVSICCNDHTPWRIVVEDHGVGSAKLALDATPSARSFGLASIGHRIKKIGGTMEVTSQPDQGTRVVLTVPLELP